jgi:HAD superfamily hydrolase (TIGR01509 family)
MLKGILWDLDGTLVEFQIDYKRARSTVIQILESNGYPKGQLSADDLILQMFQLAREYFIDQRGMDEAGFQNIRQQADKEVIEIEREAAERAMVLPGIRGVLEYAQKLKLKQAILTYNTSANAILSVEKAGLREFFPDNRMIIGRDMVVHAKPHPDHTNLALKEMGIMANEVVIIGDHPRDIEAANNVNAKSIALTQEKHPATEFATKFSCAIPEIDQNLIGILKKLRITSRKA